MNRIAVAALIVLATGAAQASSLLGNQALTRWKIADNCAKQAQKAFPDFTAEANAKRDAKLNECLSGAILPPREPLSPKQ
jgi:hypothetical protein